MNSSLKPLPPRMRRELERHTKDLPVPTLTCTHEKPKFDN